MRSSRSPRPSYYEHQRRGREPGRTPVRVRRDEALMGERSPGCRGGHHQVYGVRKVWKHLKREGIEAAKGTVRRLMRRMGIQGATRGAAFRVTTTPGRALARPRDLVDRNFTAQAPNQLQVADLTYVATWSGLVYVAFVVDVYSRMIVDWGASTSLRTDLALDALEQAIWARLDGDPAGLIHHSGAGSQYLSIPYTERLAENGVVASVGSKGDSYDCEDPVAGSRPGLGGFRVSLPRVA